MTVMCGIVGSTIPNSLIVDLLGKLGHRGDVGCGVAILGQKLWKVVKDLGPVTSLKPIGGFSPSKMSLGHTRYATNGDLSIQNLQPMTVVRGNIAFVFNGNVFNYQSEETWLCEQGYVFRSDGDSERLATSFSYRLKDFQKTTHSFEEALERTLNHIAHAFDGAYSCIAASSEWGMVGFRDRRGVRPLEGLQTESGFILASESVVFPERLCSHGHRFEVSNFGYVWIDLSNQLVEGLYNQGEDLEPRSLCFMEIAYFAHRDSVLDGLSILKAREYLGRALGVQVLQQIQDLSDLVVVPIPKTSLDIAPLIAQVMDVDCEPNVITVLDPNLRTFIQPTSEERRRAVKKKFAFSKPSKRRVLLVDDSICRGTTLKEIVSILRGLGIEWIGCASATPPVKYSAVYGIEMGNVDQLIAAQCDTQENMRIALGLDLLIMASPTKVSEVILSLRSKIDSLTMEYLTNHYPLGHPRP